MVDAAWRQAETLPFVSEFGEISRWRAHLRRHRGGPGDLEAAREELEKALEFYERHGMPRHHSMVADWLESISGSSV